VTITSALGKFLESLFIDVRIYRRFLALLPILLNNISAIYVPTAIHTV
jgi:hypothetical protein